MCDANCGCEFLLAHVYCFSGVFDLILKFHKVQPLCKDVATIIALFAEKINPYYMPKSKICRSLAIISLSVSRKQDAHDNYYSTYNLPTKDSSLDWFAVGDYKKRANTVGGRETCKPSEVHKAMDKLVTNFNSKSDITIDDIIELHADFEYIHPFQDGNGRVGRLIALKECLRFNIIPFIIEDSKKSFYYRGLANWNQEKGWLRDTCLDGQDTFKRILKVLDIHE